MNESAINIMQIICVLCVIGAGLSMMVHAVLSYRILAASALVLGSLLSSITWGYVGAVAIFASIFIALPIVCLAVVNFGLWAAWQAIRRNGHSEEPNHPPGGYITLTKVYRGILLPSG